MENPNDEPEIILFYKNEKPPKYDGFCLFNVYKNKPTTCWLITKFKLSRFFTNEWVKHYVLWDCTQC